MNSRTILKLRRKFIVVAMLTYSLVMVFMGACINVSNSVVSTNQIRRVLDYILAGDGMISYRIRGDRGDQDPASPEHSLSSSAPDSEISAASSGSEASEGKSDLSGKTILEEFSPEFHNSARYFTAAFNEDGEVTDLRTTHISELTPEEAVSLAETAYHMNMRYGRIGYYYFKRGTISTGQTMVVLLNCLSQIRSNARVLTITLFFAAAGLLITFILVYIFSSRVIQPEIQNIRRQKQFITNASHELKTPLAVIRANTEIVEMINGESEWTQSTMRQVDRLDGLVQNLVMISRAAEREDRSVMTKIDVSKHVEESVNPYRSLAQQEKKELVAEIQSGVRMIADESKIRQLTALLVDNAFKYCDEGGTIRVTLESIRKGRTVKLVVSNSYSEGANVDYSRFFERFYREDESHNVDMGGYGIGLSIAESICQQYSGSINVSWRNGEIFFTCLLN